jgi:hypothetical protein
MSTSVRLICPNLKCRAILSVPEMARGKTVRCRACGMRIGVPGGSTGPVPTPVASGGAADTAPKPA